MRGVAAMLVDEATLGGAHTGRARIGWRSSRSTRRRCRTIAATVAPRVIVFTNLFRDQLDRYGEVDTVAQAWRARARAQRRGEHDARAQRRRSRGRASRARSRTARRSTTASTNVSAAATATSTRRTSAHACECGAELATTPRSTVTSATGAAMRAATRRPKPDVRVTRVALGDDATAMTIATPDGELAHHAAARGAVQRVQRARRDAGAHRARTAARRDRHGARWLLGRVRAAGAVRHRWPRRAGAARQEPHGPQPGAAHDRRASRRAKRVLFFLNDGIADGRDISWIWDADYELLRAADRLGHSRRHARRRPGAAPEVRRLRR